MKGTSRGEATAVRPWSAWPVAVALAVALGPAAATGRDRDAAALQPEQIRTVQRALRERGLHVEPTGAWDEPTRSGLAEFQASKGLPKTGQLDPATARALGVSPRAVEPAKEANPDPSVNCDMNITIDCRPGGGG